MAGGEWYCPFWANSYQAYQFHNTTEKYLTNFISGNSEIVIDASQGNTLVPNTQISISVSINETYFKGEATISFTVDVPPRNGKCEVAYFLFFFDEKISIEIFKRGSFFHRFWWCFLIQKSTIELNGKIVSIFRSCGYES